MKFFRSGVLSLTVLLAVAGCSSTQKTTTESGNDGDTSIFPSWYQRSEFSSDSLNYHGFATAIDTDSVRAVQRAEDQARLHLEKNIGDLTEEIRSALVEGGNSDAGNTDFIIILRNAHASVGEAASLSESSGTSRSNYFRAFAAVSISRSEVTEVLEQGFTGHPRYWRGFSSAALFDEYFR